MCMWCPYLCALSQCKYVYWVDHLSTHLAESVLDVLQIVAGMEHEALLQGLHAEAGRKFNFPSEWCSDSEDETMRAPISLTLADDQHAFSVQPFYSPTLEYYK